MHPVNAMQVKFRQKALVIGLLGALPLTAIGPPWDPAFGATAPANATATTWVVENCDDDGIGSLRDAVEVQAISGDTVDLSQLMCSTITLTSGSIHVSQDDLTLLGPGASHLTIDGDYSHGSGHYNRNLLHVGSGILVVRDLTLQNARITTDYGHFGGCIHSRGSVVLDHTVMRYCVVIGSGETPDSVVGGGAIYTAANLVLDHGTIADSGALGGYDSRGGGAYVLGNLTMSDSRIQDNQALTYYGSSLGGGVAVLGSFSMTRSTVAGNRAKDAAGHASSTAGGGIWANGPFVISQSTIAENLAQQAAGLCSMDSAPADERTIIDSTVTTNDADEAPAGIYMLGPLTLVNSTIAFNHAAAAASDGDGGIRSVLGITMQSSIVSNNTAASVPADLHGDVSGANNLIFDPGTSSVPADTLISADPLLGPLLDNGGGTASHFLLAGSPAIDTGNNSAGLDWDQRGPGFVRVGGARADIGAVEIQPPALLVDPVALDFMAVDVGDVSAALTMTLSNTGEASLHVDAIDTARPPFAQTGGSCASAPFDLASQASCTLTFTFSPIDSGPASTSLDMVSNGGNRQVTLHGEGLRGSLAVTPNVVDFDAVAVGDSAVPQTVTIRNAGSSPLVVSAVDAPNAPFVATGGTCGAPPFELDVHASCSLGFGFAPQAEGTATQTLTVTSDVGHDDFTLLGSGNIGDRIFAAGFDP